MRRGWAARDLAEKTALEARAGHKGAFLMMATYIERALAVKGENTRGHGKCVLLVGNKESGRTTVFATGHQVFSCGQEDTAPKQP